MNSRAKGARGEREWRDELRAQGFLKAHRGQQFCGLNGNADVVCPELPELHFEVKRTERGNPYEWVAQANTDCKGNIPVVAHKRNNAPWLVIMTARDFFQMLRRSDLIAGGPNGDRISSAN